MVAILHPTAGSLRAAIIAVNASTSTNNTINFNITTGTAPFVILPPVDLPAITSPVLIDGFSQPNSSANNPPIVISGSNYTVGDGIATGNGLHFLPGSDGSSVRGLVINQWIANGILLDNSSGIGLSGIEISQCFVGTDPTGVQEQANRTGIGLSATSGASIDSNVIAGSFSWFVVDNFNIRGGGIFSNSSTGTTITNNSHRYRQNRLICIR